MRIKKKKLNFVIYENKEEKINVYILDVKIKKKKLNFVIYENKEEKINVYILDMKIKKKLTFIY